ncbi:LCP family protein [Okeania sp.]|uniref:LCP family protein n=1 Tax=Okeania sp. TaxID=3100323 RepID=UPI002B4AE763|nr:LCP family protein [Okeania sp.]MEB3340960.1 LCP family protein [Okeania sp.]
MSANKFLNSTASENSVTENHQKQLPKFRPGRWFGLGLGLVGVATISATAGALLALSLSSTPLMQQSLSPEDAAVFSKKDLANSNMRLPELTRPVNILLLGIKVLTSDLEEYPQDEELGYHALVNSFKGLSDTMLLVRFDPKNQKLTLLSIPRDTRTYVEDRGLTKINSANHYGGPATSAKAVSELLGGVGIDRYVRVNVQGVEKLIDALGGVRVNVPADMKYQDDSQHLYIDLKAGEQHLNGDQALQFLRFRYDNLGDIGRVQRQQLLMRSFVEQSVNLKTLSRLPKILSVIQSHVDTNLSVEELVALMNFAAKVDRQNVQMLMVPGEFSDPKEFKASYWLPDLRSLDDMVAKHFDFGYQRLEPENLDYGMRVAIQDSTDNWETVDQLVRNLNDAGYWNVRVSKPWTTPLQVTRIVAQKGDITLAKAVQKSLGFGEVFVESTGALRSDVTIQLGQDSLTIKNESQNLGNW